MTPLFGRLLLGLSIGIAIGLISLAAFPGTPPWNCEPVGLLVKINRPSESSSIIITTKGEFAVRRQASGIYGNRVYLCGTGNNRSAIEMGTKRWSLEP